MRIEYKILGDFVEIVRIEGIPREKEIPPMVLYAATIALPKYCYQFFYSFLTVRNFVMLGSIMKKEDFDLMVDDLREQLEIIRNLQEEYDGLDELSVNI